MWPWPGRKLRCGRNTATWDHHGALHSITVPENSHQSLIHIVCLLYHSPNRMQLEHISWIGSLKFIQLTSHRGHLYRRSDLMVVLAWIILKTDHSQHPLHDVLFLENGKRNMDVLLNLAKCFVKPF
jgi:hypothetical protein